MSAAVQFEDTEHGGIFSGVNAFQAQEMRLEARARNLQNGLRLIDQTTEQWSVLDVALLRWRLVLA